MKKLLTVVGLMALSSMATAMEVMDDEALSTQIGQDGLTVKISASTIKFDQMSIIDTNGINGNDTYKQPAALVIAPTTSSSGPVQLQLLDAAGKPTNNTVIASIDSDAGTGASGAFANINLAFADLKKVDIGPLSIYLAKPTGTVGTIGATGNIFTGNALRGDVTRLLSLNSGAQINFVKDKAPTINIQLGNAAQGHMFAFGGSLESINLPAVELFSKGTTNSSLKINNLQLKGSTAAGISLNNFYAGVETGGLVFGNTGASDKFDLSIDSVMAGAATATPDPNIFNGLKNGSMGGFGMVGASVTNLKVNVKGM